MPTRCDRRLDYGSDSPTLLSPSALHSQLLVTTAFGLGRPEPARGPSVLGRRCPGKRVLRFGRHSRRYAHQPDRHGDTKLWRLDSWVEGALSDPLLVRPCLQEPGRSERLGKGPCWQRTRCRRSHQFSPVYTKGSRSLFVVYLALTLTETLARLQSHRHRL